MLPRLIRGVFLGTRIDMPDIVINPTTLSQVQQQQLLALADQAEATVNDTASGLLAEILSLSPDKLAALVKQTE